MPDEKITFDKAARVVFTVCAVLAAYFVLDYLSAVLLPFAVAWLLAYLLYPLVLFIQHRLRVRSRALSIVLTVLLVIAVVIGLMMFIIPPMVEQFNIFTKLASDYLHNVTKIDNFPSAIKDYLAANSKDIEVFLKSEKFSSDVKDVLPQLFSFMGKTMSIIWSILASCIVLLYMCFILMDYEYLSKNWIRIFPKHVRPFWSELMGDVKDALNNYIRGQGLVALTMGVLFCIGFTIIGFPMAIGLGIMIGIMDMVPYLHTLALIPTAFLAALKAAESGQNYWVVLASALAVFAIVQLIIDAIVTPKIMGKRMGLNPAVLLLSLSVWGALLGFIGLIIALPATTVIISYWQRYVTKDKMTEATPETIPETTPENKPKE
jgi:predicted PurR-regulated permease PerM